MAGRESKRTSVAKYKREQIGEVRLGIRASLKKEERKKEEWYATKGLG
jgi:hypothetical protein